MKRSALLLTLMLSAACQRPEAEAFKPSDLAVAKADVDRLEAENAALRKRVFDLEAMTRGGDSNAAAPRQQPVGRLEVSAGAITQAPVTVAPSPISPRRALEVESASGQVQPQERGNWYVAWVVDVRNTSEVAAKEWITAQFLDSSGFVLDSGSASAEIPAHGILSVRGRTPVDGKSARLITSVRGVAGSQ